VHRFILKGIGLREWAAPSHLDLLGAEEFRQRVNEAFSGQAIQFNYFRLMGAISNLMAIIDTSKKPTS